MIKELLQNPFTMKSSKFLKVLALFLFLGTTLVAQNADQASDTDVGKKPGWWTLGINAGASYQSSDVRRTFQGKGGGITLAKNLYYKPNAPLAFDLRGRLLYANQFGQDWEASTGLEFNSALNGTDRGFVFEPILDYYDESGLTTSSVYSNHRTDLFEVGLEGVFNLNRLKEKTNVIVNLYGGINGDWYRTRIDQADNSDLEYDYSMVTATDKSTVLSQLESIRDGKYETTADGFDSENGKVTWMPSAGFELGYQLTPRFSIIGGHKVTWSRADNLDGQQWSNDKTVTSDNDIWHYTNLGLRWEIRPASRALEPPVIEIKRPRPNPYTTYDNSVYVFANIENVDNPMGVTCTFNGVDYNAFEFTPKNENFSTTLNLIPGRNELIIKAVNAAGQDVESLIVLQQAAPTNPQPTYEENPPTVKITRPTRPGQTVTNPNYQVVANIRNITSKGDIRFELNGYNNSGFQYYGASNTLKHNIRLVEGENVIKITASNADGRADDETFIYYQPNSTTNPVPVPTNPGTPPPPPCLEPVVKISSVSSPSGSNNEVSLRGTVRNVVRKNQIVIRVNGRKMYNYDFNSRTGIVSATFDLRTGKNNIEVTATTNCGSDTDTEVEYIEDNTPPCREPVVDITGITTPASTPTNPSNGISVLKANVSDVDNKNQIQLLVNGTRITNFNYNVNTDYLTADIRLKSGFNNVSITATNSCGSDTDSETVNAQTTTPTTPTTPTTTPKPPVVDITKPSNNQTFSVAGIQVRATVTNVTSKGQVRLNLNGSNVSNFNFSTSTGLLTANITLKSGNNTIQVTAQNNDGSDSDMVRVTYNRPAPQVKPPTVKITRPNNGVTVSSPNTQLAALVTNVNSKNELTVKLNGRNIPFTFGGTQVMANLTLNEGQNTITVKAQNQGGQDQDVVKVTYNKPVPKPVVKFVNPGRSSVSGVTKSAFTVKATVLNVTSKNQIVFQMNGRNMPFNYNTSTKVLTSNVNLVVGNNTFKIKATNSGGSDSKTASVKYSRPRPGGLSGAANLKPKVEITGVATPVPTPMNPNPGKSTLDAKTTHVSSKSQIEIRVNNKKITDFTFDSRKGEVEAKIDLGAGRNEIVIKVSTSKGTAEDIEIINK